MIDGVANDLAPFIFFCSLSSFPQALCLLNFAHLFLKLTWAEERKNTKVKYEN